MKPIEVACPKCGMGQGQKCRTLTTNRSTDTHEARWLMMFRVMEERRDGLPAHLEIHHRGDPRDNDPGNLELRETTEGER